MVWGEAVCKPSASCRRCSEQRASLRRSLGRCAGHGINDLNQYREPETVTLVLGLTFDRSSARRECLDGMLITSERHSAAGPE
jgi:hypothetical protein